LPSALSTNAPFFVPTSTRTLLIAQSLRLAVMRRRRVAAQQHLVANAHADVHHLVGPLRILFRHGAGAEGKPAENLAAQRLLIQAKGFVTLPVEVQIRLNVHSCFSSG
jgi:hypothetical protein